jgi:hypothetical protein
LVGWSKVRGLWCNKARNCSASLQGKRRGWCGDERDLC